ncbi:MAG: hypothetical protein JSV49_05185, partial [Thermoplasmata archaeon]
MKRILIAAASFIILFNLIFSNSINTADNFKESNIEKEDEGEEILIDSSRNVKTIEIGKRENNDNFDFEIEAQWSLDNLQKSKANRLQYQEPDIASVKPLEERFEELDVNEYISNQKQGIGSRGSNIRANLIVGDTPGEIFTIGSGSSYNHNGNIIIIGSGQVQVNGILNLTGNLLISNQGKFVVDNGVFRIKGDDTHILANRNGNMKFQNYSLFHYEMTYLHQHALVLYDDAGIEIEQTHISHSGSSGTIIMYDNSYYTVLNSTYSDWKTWYLHDDNFLKLENVYIGGDIVFYGGATMEFINTMGIMPWLYFGSGAVVDYSFPIDDPLTPVSASINNSTPGISGIPWSFSAVNCYSIAWGINPYPGSNVTVRNSELKMILFRFVGDHQMDIEGVLVNNMSYSDLTFPIWDRTLRLVNTSVNWWKVDIHEGFRLNATSIRFSEMVVAHNSVGHLYNSTCEGQTVHLGAQEEAYVHFESGEVWSYTSVWANATMILRDSIVDYRKGEYTYQTRNLAHGNSRLYCLNTSFGYETAPSESEPEAMDNALVMYLTLDFPGAVKPRDVVEFSGSAWIKT